MTIPGSSDFDLVCIIAAQLRALRGVSYPMPQAIREAIDIVRKAKLAFAVAIDVEDRSELRGYALPAWKGVDFEERYQ